MHSKNLSAIRPLQMFLRQQIDFSGKKDKSDEMFRKIYDFFSSQITRTIKISKTFKFQIFNNNSQFIACSKERLFKVNLDPEQIEYKDMPFPVTSVAIDRQGESIFVSLDCELIQIYSVQDLSLVKEIPTPSFQVKLLKSVGPEVIIGQNDSRLVRWKWVNDEFIEDCSIEIGRDVQLIEFNISYVILVKQFSWEIIDYNKTPMLNGTSNVPLRLAAISHHGTHFAIIKYNDDYTRGSLIIYNSVDGTKFGKLKLRESHLTDIVMIKFTTTEVDVLAGYKRGAFSVLNLNKANKVLSIAQKDTEIAYMSIDSSNQFIFSCGLNNIYITPIPKRESINFYFNEDISNVREIVGETALFLIKYDPETLDFFLSIINFKSFEVKDYDLSVHLQYDQIISLEHFKPLNVFYIAFKESKYRKIAVLNTEFRFFSEKLSFEYGSEDQDFKMLLTPDMKYLVLNLHTVLKVYLIPSYEVKGELVLYSRISTICYVPKMSSLVYDYPKKKKIRIWDFVNSTTDNMKIMHSDKITALTTTLDEKYMFSGDKSGKIGIWNLKMRKFIMFLEGHTSEISSLRTINLKLFSYTVDSWLFCWELKSKAISVKSRGKVNQNSMIVTSDDNWFIHASGRDIQVNENLMKKTSINVVGVSEPIRFMKYIKKLYPREIVLKFDRSFETGVIFPYCLTPMHFFAYLNHGKHLKKALKSGSALANSTYNENPLSLAAKQHFTDCIGIIINHLVKNYDLERNPYLLRVVNNNTIIALNEIYIKNLRKLYDLFIRKSVNRNLPRFIPKKTKTPKYVLSNEVIPTESDFNLGEIVGNKVKEVNFFETLVKFNLTLGSTDSNKFLKSLINSPNKDILTSSYVKVILDYKWRQLKRFLLAEAVLYLIHVVLLLIYTVWFLAGDPPMDKSTFLVFPFIVNLLIYPLELFQIRANYKDYFLDSRNYLDQFRSLLFVSFTICVWADVEPVEYRLYFLVTLLVTFMRGISYFSIFSRTRYLIHLIQEVISDSTAFLIIFLYTTIASGFLLHGLSENSGVEELFTSMGESYRLNLGDFSTDNYEFFEWIVFIFATLINPILMLNLLISIMSDTYDRVKATISIADSIELAEIILEAESLYFLNRKVKKPEYLQMCTDKNINGEVNSEEKMNKMRKTLKEHMENQGIAIHNIQEAQKEQRIYMDTKFAEIASMQTAIFDMLNR